jgi:hypothetical protein
VFEPQPVDAIKRTEQVAVASGIEPGDRLALQKPGRGDAVTMTRSGPRC